MGKDIELTADEILNSRFYGVADVRGRQLDDLEQNIAKTGYTWYGGNQTVDALNHKIGIICDMFWDLPSLGMVREQVDEAVNQNAPNVQDAEVQAWGEWLREPSRWNALMMYEMNGEECRRQRHLDCETVDQTSHVDTSVVRDLQNIHVDENQKIIYRGDMSRAGDRSNFINSGLETQDGYKVYWLQEDCGTDDARRGCYSWTEEMKDIHEIIINANEADTVAQGYEELAEIAYDDIFNNEDNAIAFAKVIQTETENWQGLSAQYRFFRLTSLMGMDFFVSRGNIVRFAREENQPNYTGGAVNRVITDSEWAHAEDMGYVAGGNVRRYDNDDRFKLRR